MKTHEFSVYQFFQDGMSDCECSLVDFEFALHKFKFLTTNVSARFGLTRRVIITDGGDCVVAEWQYGKGYTYY